MNIQTNYINQSTTQTFGTRNPKAVLARAKSLKNLYGNLGINYKLPSETLSNKEIAKHINKIGKIIDELDSNELNNIDNIQKIVNNNMPINKVQNEIKVKDFSEYLEIEKKKGASKEDLNILNLYYDAMTLYHMDTNDITIFLKKKSPRSIKNALKHELTHVYNFQYQNISAYDRYNINKVLNNKIKLDAFDKFYQNSIDMVGSLSNSQKNEFNKVFELAYKKFPKKQKNITSLTYNMHVALDESLAHKNTDSIRQQKFYEEMTKFFAQKVKELKSS